jgi:hypothetical protein
VAIATDPFPMQAVRERCAGQAWRLKRKLSYKSFILPNRIRPTMQSYWGGWVAGWTVLMVGNDREATELRGARATPTGSVSERVC